MQRIKKTFATLLLTILLTSISVPTQADTTYQYDLLGRLISVVHDSGKTITYSYDAHGNMTVVVVISDTIELAGQVIYQASPKPAEITLCDSAGTTIITTAKTNTTSHYTLSVPQAPAETTYTP